MWSFLFLKSVADYFPIHEDSETMDGVFLTTYAVGGYESVGMHGTCPHFHLGSLAPLIHRGDFLVVCVYGVGEMDFTW
jgi:hypothetical protein